MALHRVTVNYATVELNSGGKGRDKLDVSLALKCELADLSYLAEKGL